MVLILVIFVFVLINSDDTTMEKILVGLSVIWLFAGFTLIGYALALVQELIMFNRIVCAVKSIVVVTVAIFVIIIAAEIVFQIGDMFTYFEMSHIRGQFMFIQMFEEDTSTFTYIIGDDATKEAVIIDPVDVDNDKYIAIFESTGYTLKYAVETHVHADHITGGAMLHKATGAEIGVSGSCGAVNVDVQLKHGDVIKVGEQVIKVVSTRGHTSGSISFIWDGKVFTGDSLLINGSGRVDFQGGNAGEMYDDIYRNIFTLPSSTKVYPGHDYNGNRVSTVGKEIDSNSRIGNGATKEEFIATMDALELPLPRYIDVAVPRNQVCGF